MTINDQPVLISIKVLRNICKVDSSQEHMQTHTHLVHNFMIHLIQIHYTVTYA